MPICGGEALNAIAVFIRASRTALSAERTAPLVTAEAKAQLSGLRDTAFLEHVEVVLAGEPQGFRNADAFGMAARPPGRAALLIGAD
ncbi:hypothetical protein L107_08923 [Cyanobium sp. Copco_Reservoir_LC18]|uniref:hypothetical protein n=1 Tax=Cyanobium sp. Copco_Reservoir_LC18 TaxID=1328305 RepID=UPI00135C570A|nr:hypothetical protein [Cyanobium sp. Copco_Reservoir_LC18]KAF0653701.1 hypothetical protein L107_08923 [Cyanobium sp. Copco_Reservoir_LC18]